MLTVIRKTTLRYFGLMWSFLIGERYTDLGLPWWLNSKEPTCWCRRIREGLIPRLGGSPRGGHGNPFQYLFLKHIFFFNWRITALHNLLFSVKHQQESAIGAPMSPPSWNSLPSPFPSYSSRLLQSRCLSSLSHSCLENPMDRGAWRATGPWGRKELGTTEAT